MLPTSLLADTEMSTYTVAVVGTGPHPDRADHDGFSMGYRHSKSYEKVDECEIVACADIVPEHGADFAAEFGVPDDRVYEDYERLLAAVEPDIVSVCTPPSTHLKMVTAIAESGVDAIHCEKPIATTWGDTRALVDVCESTDVQLTINLQNRCSDTAGAIRELIEDGAIGELRRIELQRPDLLQTGVHQIDLAQYFVDDARAEWIIGQIDYPDEHVWYTDMHAEKQSFALWRYENGVHAMISTGYEVDAIGCPVRLRGDEGTIEFDLGYGYDCRYRRHGDAGWTTVGIEKDDRQTRAVEEVVRSLDDGTEPIISGARALGATELVFSVWECARRRGRVDLPLEITDNPLVSMIESGDLPPE